MLSLQRDLPELAEQIEAAAVDDQMLGAALKDYHAACERLADETTSNEERAEWDRIRTELIGELTRLVRRLSDKRPFGGIRS